MTDTEMLNFLDSCTDANKRICMRESSSHRGWRLHVISESEAEAFEVTTYKTVREAIEAFKVWTEGV